MQFNVSGHLEYTVRFPSTLILNIHAQKNSGQLILQENFVVQPPLARVEEFQLTDGCSRFVRLETGNAAQFTIDYTATVDCSHEIVPANTIDQTPVGEMDRSAIPYLFPSRYCQSDRLSRLAWDLFGGIPHPYDKVLAIVDWIHDNVEYVIGSTDSETSAYDTVTQRTGVCRDFAHLGIALCRALNIPARYFSGYAYQLDPPDFHACFECFVGGKWFLFDATGLAPLNGLVRIGTGRDAADSAVASTFGRVQCTLMTVDCQLAPNQQFEPLGRTQLSRNGLSLGSGRVQNSN
ncbi:MAG: transglutaminase family protein [Planctomyces sp.]|nr:transglutaminase family protein [Planctomyces sp.]